MVAVFTTPLFFFITTICLAEGRITPQCLCYLYMNGLIHNLQPIRDRLNYRR